MLGRTAIVAMTLLCLGACSSYQANGLKMDATAQHYSQFDLVLGWDTRVVEGRTVIEGVVKNVRYPYMEDLEIWVDVLNDAGKRVSRSVTFVIPHQLEMDRTAPFTLELPVAVAPGTKLRFTYKYRGNEGGGGDGDGGGGTIWWQSFDIAVPAGQ